MKDKKISSYSMLSAIGIAVYIFVVATVMQHAARFLGDVDDVVSAMAFLMLFVLSAGVVGGLVLGKPIMLYVDGKKKEGVHLFIYTMGWLLILLIVVFAMVALI